MGPFQIQQALMAKLGLDTSGFERGLQRANRQAEDSGRKMTRAFRTTVAVVAALSSSMFTTVNALGQMADRGSQVANVGRAYTRVVVDQEQSLRTLRNATRGLVSDYDLMVGFNKALTLEAVQTTDQFAELSRVGIQLGRALGVDAAHAVESLALGIGRQSRLILDNLGLIVSVEEANRKYAVSLGTVAANLTAAQQKEAFRVAAMEDAREKALELGGAVRTAGDAWKQLRVEIDNTIASMNQGVSGSGYVQSIFDEIRSLLSIARGGDPVVDATKASLSNLPLDALQMRGREFQAMATGTTRGRVLAGNAGFNQGQATQILDFINRRVAALREEARLSREIAEAERRRAEFAVRLGAGVASITAPKNALGRPFTGDQVVAGHGPVDPSAIDIFSVAPTQFNQLYEYRRTLHENAEQGRRAAEAAAEMQERMARVASIVENRLSAALTRAILQFRTMGELVRDIGQTLLSTVVELGVRAAVTAGLGAIGVPIPAAAAASGIAQHTGGTPGNLRISMESIPEPTDYGIIAGKRQIQALFAEMLREARHNGSI